MEGSTLHWVRWMRQQVPDISWLTLKEELLRHYDSCQADHAFERLNSVSQSDSVATYINEFIAVATHVLDLAPDHYLGYFLAGLHPHLRAHLWVHNPTTLSHAMEQARCLDEELYPAPPSSSTRAPPPPRPLPPPLPPRPLQPLQPLLPPVGP
ncbi:hypothetical protein KSP39_PZI003420 [Platanthera zijinensis]|uniref:Retrotransposon gag domain-containing protein n=1 Tax=Platanthera zijinensis TaxID=2320716 RepID=A0AAP0BVI8_9ASPA